MGEPARSVAPATSAAPSADTEGRLPREKSALREYGEALGVALVLALFIRTFFIQAYKIPSGSMEPTLLVGDQILVNKFIYGLRLPDSVLGLHIPGIPYGRYLFHLEAVHRGDVVVFVFPPDPSKDFIKRVIAVPGDSVEVRDGVLYLNGEMAADSHAHYEIDAQARSAMSPRDSFGPVKVPPGKLFVMGDNRDRSYDSRFWGFVDQNLVEGHALIIYWSWDGDGSSLVPIRWTRIGSLVE